MKWEFPLAWAGSDLQALEAPVISSEAHVQYATDISSDSTVVWPWREFKSSPHTPPHMNITHYDGKPLSDGYVFVTPSDINGADGTEELSGTGFIMTMDGELVYAAEENGWSLCEKQISGMTDFRAQDYQGKKVLTYWNGCNTKGSHWGHRWGTVTFIDENYNNFTINPDLGINTLDPANTGQIDVHEHQMTPRNTMIVSSYNNSQIDITALGGHKDAWISDGMFFEIDIETQEVLFEWKALDHLPLNGSHVGWKASGGATARAPWDWFHINSIQAVGENYLVNARHHWATYLVSGRDGHIIWKLDGVTGGDFGQIPEDAHFRWQHHARAHNVSRHGMAVSMFNNKVAGQKNKDTQTEGLVFYLPMPADPGNPPKLLRRLKYPSDPLFAGTQGSYTVDLGNGNQFMGYGSLPIAREYGPAADGSDLRWQAQFGTEDAVQSYRVFKDTWHGTPANWDPTLVVERVSGDTFLARRDTKCYVSWNGATDVQEWAVFAGPDMDHLESVGVAQKRGFETTFKLPDAICVQVEAVQNKKTIRKSNVACI